MKMAADGEDVGRDSVFLLMLSGQLEHAEVWWLVSSAIHIDGSDVLYTFPVYFSCCSFPSLTTSTATILMCTARTGQ